MGADIVTVSTDTQFVHLAWQKSEKELANVRYTMAADPTGNVSRMFGVYNEGNGLDLRGTFLINPEGTLLNMDAPPAYSPLGYEGTTLRMKKASCKVRLSCRRRCPTSPASRRSRPRPPPASPSPTPPGASP